MSLKHLIVTTPLILLLTQGCSNNSSIFSKDRLPLVHKVDVQQGNVITQEMLAKLQTGMTKKKVRFIMGTPLISDTFHTDRWDYVYTYKDGRELREQRRVTLFFKEELLSRVGGDIVAAHGEIKLKSNNVESVDVPPAKPLGVFSQVKDKLSFDKDKPRSEQKKAVKQPQMVGEGEEKESFLGKLFDGDEDAEVISDEDSESESDDPSLYETDQQTELPETIEEEEFAENSDTDSSSNNDDVEEVEEESSFFGELWDKAGDDETDIDLDTNPNDR